MKAYIAVGSNQGSSMKIINRAAELLKKTKGIHLKAFSRLYRTEAVGGPKQSDFLNGVIEIETTLLPKKLMAELLLIEQQLGRVRRKKWGPRIIDLDLLAMGRKVLKSQGLTLPHPRYHERRFVLVPFCDLAPGYVHPGQKKQNRTLLRKLTVHGQRVTIAALWNGTQFSLFKPRRKPKLPSSR